MSGRRFAALTALVLAQTLSGTPAGATEGGASLYIPGLLGPGAGIVPPPGFYFSNVAYSYSGELRGGRRIQIGGAVLADVEIEARADFLSGTWVTPITRGMPKGTLTPALDEAREKGWTVVDMKQDWRTVFPMETGR
jgi:hypothetical protein